MERHKEVEHDRRHHRKHQHKNQDHTFERSDGERAANLAFSTQIPHNDRRQNIYSLSTMPDLGNSYLNQWLAQLSPEESSSVDLVQNQRDIGMILLLRIVDVC
jgi:hypothetical protein